MLLSSRHRVSVEDPAQLLGSAVTYTEPLVQLRPITTAKCPSPRSGREVANGDFECHARLSTAYGNRSAESMAGIQLRVPLEVMRFSIPLTCGRIGFCAPAAIQRLK